MLIPYIKYHLRVRAFASTLDPPRPITIPEAQALRSRVDVMQTTYDAYSSAVLQMGYTALFVSALPVAAVYALLLNIVTIRENAYSWMHLKERPSPKGTEDIGSWLVIMRMLAVVSVLTNAGLVAFTVNALSNITLRARFWIFVGFQWVCFALQGLVSVWVSEESEEVSVQLQRTEFIVSKVLDQTPDDAAGYDPHVDFTMPLMQEVPKETAMIIYT